MHPSRDNIPYLQQKCEKMLGLGVWIEETDSSVRWEWHNTYVTTIHAINRYEPRLDTYLCMASDPRSILDAAVC